MSRSTSPLAPSLVPLCPPALWLLTGALLAGCGHARPPEVTRVLDGETRRGPFVDSTSYEAFVRAELDFEAGEWARAIEGYRRALRSAPDDPLVVGRLSESLEHADRGAEADGLLEDALSARPDAEALWMARGRIDEGREALSAALEAYTRAMRGSPRSEEPPVATARLLLRMHTPAEATAEFRRRATGVDADARLRAELLLAIEAGEVEQAAARVDAIVTRGSARRDEIAAAAQLALESGQPELAARLIDLAPSDTEHAALRARIYRAVGREQEADSLLLPE